MMARWRADRLPIAVYRFARLPDHTINNTPFHSYLWDYKPNLMPDSLREAVHTGQLEVPTRLQGHFPFVYKEPLPGGHFG